MTEVLKVKKQTPKKFKLYIRVKKEGKKVLVVKRKEDMEDES